MDSRRRDLRLTWDEVAARAGINRETLRQIRIGSGEIRALSVTGIEDALEWERGSIDAILADGEPTPLETETPSQFDQDMTTAHAVLDEIERDPRLRARLHRIIEAASGQPPRGNDSDEEGGAGRNVAG